MELWVNELWLLATAIVFTFVGKYFGKYESVTLTEAVIDSLIEQGYLKTTGTGKDMQIIKHTEWSNDQTTD